MLLLLCAAVWWRMLWWCLQLETVDVGQHGGESVSVSVVSSLGGVYSLEALQGRLVILLCNTKPRNVGGARSHGLILTASNAEGAVELLDPPAGAVVGERIAFPPLQPLPSALTPLPPLVGTKAKPEVWDAVMAQLHIISSGVVAFSASDAVMTSSAGPVSVKTLKEGQIK